MSPFCCICLQSHAGVDPEKAADLYDDLNEQLEHQRDVEDVLGMRLAGEVDDVSWH